MATDTASPDDSAPDMAAVLEVATRLETARASVPGFDGAEAGPLIRLVPGKRAVFEGRLDGRPVVFRVTLDPRDDSIAREWAEMQRLWPHMCDGRFRIAEPLLCAPEQGILVIAAVSGTPLMQHLWQSPPETRTRHFLPAATWLRRATDMSEGWQPARVRGWIGRAERAATRQPFASLRRIESDLLEELARIGALIEGQDWRCAICHGDMHPNNLILDGDTLTGIDLGGSARTPVYKDMARFLVHMGRRGMLPSGRAWLGVDADGIEAFTTVFGLTGRERRLCLPFMIGVEVLIRVESEGLSRSRIRRAEAMYAATLDDMRRTGDALDDV